MFLWHNLLYDVWIYVFFFWGRWGVCCFLSTSVFSLKYGEQIRIFTDMLARSKGSLPRESAVYDCGFPCQPFSMLNVNGQKLQDPRAQVFRESMKTIWVVEPLVGVLENVVGLLRVWSKITKYLDQQTAYHYGRLVINPRHLGDGVCRRRVYILLIHKPLEYYMLATKFVKGVLIHIVCFVCAFFCHWD